MRDVVDFTFASPELAKFREDTEKDYLDKARRVVVQVTREAELALEDATAAAGLGRLSRAWASQVYPRTGRSWEPVGYIYPKGGKRTEGSLRSYAYGASIRGKDGSFLAIPTPAAGSRGRNQGLTPGEWERRTGQRLRFIYRPGRASLLVAEGVTNARTGSFRQITRKRTKADERRGYMRGAQTVVIFILLPVVNVAARFSIQGTLAPFEQRLADAFEQAARG